MCAHVAMSVLVYFAYVRRKLSPFFDALAIHVAIDATAAILGAKHLWLVESILAVVAMICLVWLVRFWRGFRRGVRSKRRTRPYFRFF
jgi:hypothetical protein